MMNNFLGICICGILFYNTVSVQFVQSRTQPDFDAGSRPSSSPTSSLTSARPQKPLQMTVWTLQIHLSSALAAPVAGSSPSLTTWARISSMATTCPIPIPILTWPGRRTTKTEKTVSEGLHLSSLNTRGLVLLALPRRAGAASRGRISRQLSRTGRPFWCLARMAARADSELGSSGLAYLPSSRSSPSNSNLGESHCAILLL